jgi:RNA polymerase sigma factor (sigma-70 family)
MFRLKPPAPDTAQFRDWLARIRAGDDSARDELLRAVARRLEVLTRRTFRRFAPLRRWEQTDDVLQEVKVRLLDALPCIQSESLRAFYALSAVVIRQMLIDLWRRYFGPHGLGARYDSDPELVERLPAPPDDAAAFGLVHEEVEHLRDDQREVFQLLYYHDLKQAEAADLLGVDVRTVQRRWAAALRQLRRRIKGQRDGSDSGVR